MSRPRISPLAPAGGFPALAPVRGVRFATAAAGVKYRDRDDVMLAELCEGSVVAGVFTRSATRSAAVLDCQRKISGGAKGRAAILVNSGNANAFTGANGSASVNSLCEKLAATLGLEPSRVFTASTGVIGEPLPHARIERQLATLARTLDPERIEPAARAIMTTDTFPKGAGAGVTLGGVPVVLSGFAKGSGMIAPDMATMLSFVFTDALIDQAVLQDMLHRAVAQTFNCITVDSDTSTSDTLLVCATGKSGAQPITSPHSDAGRAFYKSLHAVLKDLAHQVVRDGEGATKFVEVRVTGASTDADARRVALSIANSPLVKTALAGEDPNWGRVVMAVGKSGARADRDRLRISFGDILVATQGWVAPGYSEEAAAAYMKGDELVISVDLGLGAARAVIWTCDLTHGYITINADYRS